jgi:hypothetical protein
MELGEDEIMRQNPEHAHAVNLPAYRGLHALFSALGVDGQSTDVSDAESEDEESIDNTLQPTLLFWRIPLDQELAWLAFQTKLLKGKVRRGRPFRAASRVFPRSSDRQPVPTLPVSLYRPEFLASQPSPFIYKVLKPNFGGFQWHGMTINPNDGDVAVANPI